MNFGVLDLPGFLLGPIDDLLGLLHVPAIVRVILWGILAGYASLWIYRRISPQQRIGEVRGQLVELRRQLAGYDGEFAGLMSLVRRQFGLALHQLRLTTGAALLSALPLILILPWLSNAYGVRNPEPGAEIRVCIEPAEAASRLHWSVPTSADASPECQRIHWPDASSVAELREGEVPVLSLPLPAPASIVHKRHWLNVLVGNPAGYLDAGAAMSAIHLDLPAQELIGWGPAWLRGWEASFLISALIASLWLRWRWKLN